MRHTYHSADGRNTVHGGRSPAATCTTLSARYANTCMAVTVRPLHDRLIVERIEDTERMVGRIIIPDTEKENPNRARCWPLAKAQ